MVDIPLLSDVLKNFESQPIIQSLIIFVTFFVFSKLVIIIAEKVFLRLARKTKTVIDDLIVEKTNRPVSWILVCFGIRLGLIPLGFPEQATFIISQLLYSIIILLVGRIVITVVDILVEEWGKKWAEKSKSTVDDDLISLVHKFTKAFVYILAVLVVLDGFGIAIGPMLASLGIAGLALAFALQESLANIFGGISLILDKTINVGDKVEIDEQTTGIVHDVGLRSTRIRTYDNEMVILPNGKLVQSKIVNFVQPDHKVRVTVPFGVAYGTSIDKVKKVVLKEVNQIENLKKDPEPFVKLLEMADSSINFKAYFWVNSYKNAAGAKWEANERIYNALNKAKIEIPFPQLDVQLKK